MTPVFGCQVTCALATADRAPHEKHPVYQEHLAWVFQHIADIELVWEETVSLRENKPGRKEISENIYVFWFICKNCPLNNFIAAIYQHPIKLCNSDYIKRLQRWFSTLHMRHGQQILLEIQVRTATWKGWSLKFTFSKARISSLPFSRGFHWTETDHFKSVFKVTISARWTPLARGKQLQCYLPEIWFLAGSISRPAGQQWFGWSTMSEENPHCKCSEKCVFK